ncbi:MAG: sugar phosphate isomerase/epimerase [Actinobacteria bacterium]|nr:sugar phosphate isomerase/epimerase [Actinomycetota bacterium]
MKLQPIKYATTLAVFGPCSDRFISSYKSKVSLESKFRAAASVPSIEAVDMYGNWDITRKNVDEVKSYLKKYDLVAINVTQDTSSLVECARGGVASPDKKVREIAIEHCRTAIDLAAMIDCPVVDFWFGQDGYDYCFQMDHVKAYSNLISIIRDMADYNPEIDIGIEYKPREPRNYCYISSMAKTILLIDKISRPNVGVILDTGHALQARENLAESVALLEVFGTKLIGMHMNDNYGYWDDDLMVGSVHTIATLEYLYWLERIKYSGYITLDIFPYRENGVEAATECVEWIKRLRNIIATFDEDELEALFAKNDGVASMKFVREKMLK